MSSLVSSCPPLVSSRLALYQALRLLRLSKMLRVAKLAKLVQKYTDNLDVGPYVVLLGLLFVIVSPSHNNCYKEAEPRPARPPVMCCPPSCPRDRVLVSSCASPPSKLEPSPRAPFAITPRRRLTCRRAARRLPSPPLPPPFRPSPSGLPGPHAELLLVPDRRGQPAAAGWQQGHRMGGARGLGPPSRCASASATGAWQNSRQLS